jgi:hypothetical protein
MVVKTLKIPAGLNTRIQRAARTSRRTASAVMREALERGLGEDGGIDMGAALRDFIGCIKGGPRDLSRNKAHFHDFGRSRHR